MTGELSSMLGQGTHATQLCPEPSRRPFIRPARFEDYDGIAAVEKRNDLAVKPRDEWMSLWLDNPAYLALDGWPIGWVIEDGSGQIAGSLGNVPVAYHLDGNRYIASAGRGWAVDPSYRSLALLLLSHQWKQPLADLNVVATASAITASLCTKLGWSRVPSGKWDQSAFWVANYTKAARAYLENKASKFVSTVVGTALSPPLYLRDAICSRPYSFSGASYRLEWLEAFDERFDPFWARLREAHPTKFLTARDRKTLAWHFRHALEQKQIWILTASAGTHLVGYAILERRAVQSADLSRALFIDLQTLQNEPMWSASKLTSSMVRFALNRCRAEQIDILENVGCWIEDRETLDPSPYHRNLETWCYLYRAANPELADSLRHAEAWLPTLYDGDASL